MYVPSPELLQSLLLPLQKPSYLGKYHFIKKLNFVLKALKTRMIMSAGKEEPSILKENYTSEETSNQKPKSDKISM